MKKYIFLILLLSACEPIRNNSVSPIINPETGVSEGEASFYFEHELGDDSEYITAQTNDGEFFRGTVVVSKSTSTGYEDTSIFYKENGKKKHRDEMTQINTTNYNSAAHAVLIGDQGHSMECHFTLIDPEFGLASGGAVGNCNISDGRKVPLDVRNNNKYGFKFK